MQKTARGIIFKEIDGNKCIVSIKRTKYTDDGEYIYYTFPGGHVENDESFTETLIREIDEELGVKVEIENLLLELYNTDLDREEKFYICKRVSGVIGTGTGPEWQNVDYKKYGKYEICYINIDEILNYNLLPKEVSIKLSEMKF